MDYFEHIEAYQRNTLTEAERQAFEAAMEADPKLAQAVADHEVAMDVIGSILEGEVRKVIAGVTKRSQSVEYDSARSEGTAKAGEQDAGKVKRMNWMRWAAAAVVIGVVGWWGVQEYQFNQLEDEVFANYLDVLDNSGTRGLTLGATVSDSLKYFHDLGRYQESSDLYSTISNDSLLRSVHIHQAFNLFNLKRYGECIRLIESSQVVDDSEELKRLLFLAYIMEGKKNKARVLHSEIKDEDNKLLKLLE